MTGVVPQTLPAAPAADAAGERYAGLVTRVIAFAADAAIINGVALLGGAVVALGLSLLHLPEQVDSALIAFGAVLGLVWSIAYFVVFWTTTGQTPGDRIMQIRVEEQRTRRPVSVRRALLRVLLLPLSVLPLGAGMLVILIDARR